MALEIFICYRRKDTGGYAGRLYDHLVQRFRKDGVLFDVSAGGTAELLREWVIRVAMSRPRTAAKLHPSSGTSYLMARAAESRGVAPTAVARRAARELVKEVGRHADRLVRRESVAAHLVYDGALLVSRSREHDLSVTVRQWARRLIPLGCRVSLTGPWPPYSFVSLERERV